MHVLRARREGQNERKYVRDEGEYRGMKRSWGFPVLCLVLQGRAVILAGECDLVREEDT